VERERRREIAARDAAILAQSGEDADLAGLIRYTTTIHAVFDLE